jgi:hypothetical protein
MTGCQDQKAAADVRKAATTVATTTSANMGAKPTDTPKPPPKKEWCGPPRRFMSPNISLHASPRAAKMAGGGAIHRERASREPDPPWGTRQVQTRTASPLIQPQRLDARRYPFPSRISKHRTTQFRSLRSLGTRTQLPACVAHVPSPQTIVNQF